LTLRRLPFRRNRQSIPSPDGELRIEFFGAEDLAAKLFELSQAMTNDWQAFARAVEKEKKRARDGALKIDLLTWLAEPQAKPCPR
jgi:hypothetical protein